MTATISRAHYKTRTVQPTHCATNTLQHTHTANNKTTTSLESPSGALQYSSVRLGQRGAELVQNERAAGGARSRRGPRNWRAKSAPLHGIYRWTLQLGERRCCNHFSPAAHYSRLAMCKATTRHRSLVGMGGRKVFVRDKGLAQKKGD